MESKPTHTLHKLQQGFVITSNESYSNGDFVLLPLSFELRKCVNRTTFIEGTKKVIAQQHQIDFSALSEEEKEKIGWFDVEELAKQIFIDAYGVEPMAIDTHERLLNAIKTSLQKSQELLSDKRFTLNDIAVAFEAGRTFEVSNRESLNQIEYIQSLSQPKSWRVEIELGEINMNSGGFEKGSPITIYYPAIENGKVKILKLL